jgi:hypothetical protein
VPPEDLAAFQDALLELLAQDLPAEVIRQKLRDDPAFAEFRDYATAMEPRMLAVAVELLKKWGRRAPSVSPGATHEPRPQGSG